MPEETRKAIEQIKESIQNINRKVDDLYFKMRTHKHLGIDFSALLDATASGYPGYVKDDATFASPYFLPTGWSVANGATGQYTVTHNLGTTDYTLVGNVFDNDYICDIHAISANSFVMYIINRATGAFVNSSFTFIVLPA